MATKVKGSSQQNDSPVDLGLVLGYLAVKDLKGLEDRVAVLARLGYGNKEIARICDTTPLTVAVRKSGLKSKNRRTRRDGGEG